MGLKSILEVDFFGCSSIVANTSSLLDVFSSTNYVPWMWATVGSLLVGLSGVVPLLVIPISQSDNLKQGVNANRLKTLLSFAVGGLLGDVFLHSLPEIWANDVLKNDGQPSIETGLLILSGLILFVIAEKMFAVLEKLGERASTTASAVSVDNNNIKAVNGQVKTAVHKKQIAGYLNLLANTLDNFTHGLSLGGAFLVSLRLGVLTTFAILVHEVPHEVGDFAILLKAGFTRWDAAVFQLLTASGGLLGALVALAFSSSNAVTHSATNGPSWILPFSAGTFLHIALVTVLPDLLKEDDPWESFKQILALILGICTMAAMAAAFEH